jgi:hypothetical protein
MEIKSILTSPISTAAALMYLYGLTKSSRTSTQTCPVICMKLNERATAEKAAHSDRLTIEARLSGRRNFSHFAINLAQQRGRVAFL